MLVLRLRHWDTLESKQELLVELLTDVNVVSVYLQQLLHQEMLLYILSYGL